jgi:hypothetical protein
MTGPTRMVLGGYIMLALLTVFLTKVIDRLGVLDCWCVCYMMPERRSGGHR